MALFMAQVIFMGIVATLVIDIWAVILSTIFKLPPPIGAWLVGGVRIFALANLYTGS